MNGSVWLLMIVPVLYSYCDDDMSDDLACDKSHRMVLMCYEMHLSYNSMSSVIYAEYKPLPKEFSTQIHDSRPISTNVTPLPQ